MTPACLRELSCSLTTSTRTFPAKEAAGQTKGSRRNENTQTFTKSSIAVQAIRDSMLRSRYVSVQLIDGERLS